jgi:hypothetical protein
VLHASPQYIDDPFIILIHEISDDIHPIGLVESLLNHLAGISCAKLEQTLAVIEHEDRTIDHDDVDDTEVECIRVQKYLIVGPEKSHCVIRRIIAVQFERVLYTLLTKLQHIAVSRKKCLIGVRDIPCIVSS